MQNEMRHAGLVILDIRIDAIRDEQSYCQSSVLIMPDTQEKQAVPFTLMSFSCQFRISKEGVFFCMICHLRLCS